MIFSTYPAPYVSVQGAFFTEVSGNGHGVLGEGGWLQVLLQGCYRVPTALHAQRQPQPLSQGAQHPGRRLKGKGPRHLDGWESLKGWA